MQTRHPRRGNRNPSLPQVRIVVGMVRIERRALRRRPSGPAAHLAEVEWASSQVRGGRSNCLFFSRFFAPASAESAEANRGCSPLTQRREQYNSFSSCMKPMTRNEKRADERRRRSREATKMKFGDDSLANLQAVEEAATCLGELKNQLHILLVR